MVLYHSIPHGASTSCLCLNRLAGGMKPPEVVTKFDLEEHTNMANSNVVSMKALLEAGVHFVRSPDPSLEPQDGSLHLHRAQRYLYR